MFCTIKVFLLLDNNLQDLFQRRTIQNNNTFLYINVSFICETDSNFVLQMELLQNFYETTLDALKEAKNERLWFKTNTKLGKLYFDRGDYQKLQKILKQLHQSCQVLEHVQLFLSSLVYLTVWSGTERQSTLFWQTDINPGCCQILYLLIHELRLWFTFV